ncbi:serine/threonine protein phosphatase [Nocardioides phosphati]|uniref:Serine/threonine protein phosphatase n=1 Tax=Nocardioides phosphati TaxID=1867775 RepID=A0ABQ2N9Z4_9ACTN|nr:metallophosphoesterase [Nocardioides phosphati]GGO87743.1 serine/threonine protein phosphatase [Nocardioides phosphati]
MPASPAPVFAVSDVHGHRDDLVATLRAAGLVDAGERWSGGDAQLYVLGDLLDRGPDGIGVIRLLRGLQAEAPASVHVLLGNHEVLALGMWLHPDEGYLPLWQRNGGLAADQASLTPDDVTWLSNLPAMALVGDDLLVHSDSTAYLGWGRSVGAVNAQVAGMLTRPDPVGVAEVLRGLTQRRRFVGTQGAAQADSMLAAYGGTRVVHGHSIVATLRGVTPGHGALAYAGGKALAIDGGRYNGGPLLLVELSA